MSCRPDRGRQSDDLTAFPLSYLRAPVAQHLDANSVRRSADINFNNCGSFLLMNDLMWTTGSGSIASATCTPYRLATLRPASDNAKLSRRLKWLSTTGRAESPAPVASCDVIWPTNVGAMA